MRIAINCRSFLKPRYTGIGRYADNLVRSLAGIDRENEYWLYCAKGLFDLKRRLPRPPAQNFKLKVDYFRRGSVALLRGAQIYHKPSPGGDFLDSARNIVTVHDLVHKVFPDGHADHTRAEMDRQLQEISTRADRVICCSQTTATDLKKFFAVPELRIRTVYQGVDHQVFCPLRKEERNLAPEVLARRGIRPPFVLFVGTIEPRKNLLNLFKAMGILQAQKRFEGSLVIVGMKGWMMEDVEEQVRRAGLAERCVLAGYVPDNELRYLYNLAEVFIYPSFYEGFGFPVLEALSCGAAVITSRQTSCAEVAQDAALLVDPHDPEAMAQNIQRVLEDRALREKLRERGLARAKDFSFEQTARQTLAVYQELGQA